VMSTTQPSTADPKRPNNVVKYHIPKKELDEIDPDVYGVVSILLSTVGLIMKIKWASWVALTFALISLTNEKASDRDPNSGRTSSYTGVLFSASGLVVNYMYLFIGIPNPAANKA
ncbi:2198_t:CDS:2, partial [Scutellospora calospora]